MNFASDNGVGASDPILTAMTRANSGVTLAYGADTLTRNAEKALSAWFDRDVATFLVATGTAANALAIGAITAPWGAVLCHVGSHLMNDECGAPEFYAGGAKLLPVSGAAGKITPATLCAALDRVPRDMVRQSRPAVLSLSQGTETGTIYSIDELRALADIAHASGLRVHMDGARFANALVTLGCAPADMTWRAGVDVLSLGASKNGALACEAVVFFDPAQADGFTHQRKRGGHTWSKSRFLGAQMLAWLADDHWRDLASHANAQATRLATMLADSPGIRVAFPAQINTVFAVMPRRVSRELRAAGATFYDWHADALHPSQRLRDDEVLVRFVASFATEAAEVDRFVALLRDCAARAAGP